MSSRIRTYSPITSEALSLFGKQIRLYRKQRGWRVSDLAERLGTGRRTVTRIESGDPSVSMGTVFEAAALVGLPLFSEDSADVSAQVSETEIRLQLLPARTRTMKVDYNEF